MWETIHNNTAKICEDIEAPPINELKDPQPIRRIARLATIVAAGALLVTAIVVMTRRIPKLQSEKINFSSTSPSATYIVDVQKCLSDAVTNNHTVNCPCHNQIMSWCTFTTFHIYLPNKGDNSTFNASKTINFTRDDGRTYIPVICKQSNLDNEDICEQTLSPILNSVDTRTYLPTASAFTSPDLLYKEIALRMDTNEYEQSSIYIFLRVLNHTKSYNYSIGQVDLVRKMQSQFLQNSSSSSEDYWNASQEIRRNYSLRFSYGMDVSWETYLQTCKPAFCDVSYEISVLNRVLRAMGQVGGVTTVITLVLKFLIWPSLRAALNFPTSKLSASNPN